MNFLEDVHLRKQIAVSPNRSGRTKATRARPKPRSSQYTFSILFLSLALTRITALRPLFFTELRARTPNRRRRRIPISPREKTAEPWTPLPRGSAHGHCPVARRRPVAASPPRGVLRPHRPEQWQPRRRPQEVPQRRSFAGGGSVQDRIHLRRRSRPGTGEAVSVSSISFSRLLLVRVRSVWGLCFSCPWELEARELCISRVLSL
jgi:hypothetical protein